MMKIHYIAGLLAGMILFVSCDNSRNYEEYSEEELRLDSLRKIGNEAMRAKDYSKADSVYRSLETEIRETGNKLLLARLMNNWGVVCFELNRPAEAAEYVEIALSTYKDIGDDNLTGGCLYNMGLTSKKGGHFTLAQKFYFDAIPFLQNSGDIIQEGRCYSSLGNIHRELDEKSRSMEYHNQAIKILRNTDAPYKLAQAYTNAGHSYLEFELYHKCDSFFQAAIELKTQMGQADKASTALAGLGASKMKQKKYQESYELQRRALNIRLRDTDSTSIASSAVHLARLFTEEKNQDSANHYIEFASQFLKGVSVEVDLRFLTAWKEVEMLNENFIKALNISERILKLNQLNQRQEFRKTLRENEYNFAKDKRLRKADQQVLHAKQQQFWITMFFLVCLSFTIFLIWQQVRRRREVNRIYKTSHHRSMNDFQELAGRFQGEMLKYRGNDNIVKPIQLLREGVTRVKAMGLVHEQLHIFSENRAGVIRFDQYTETMVENMKIIYNLDEEIEVDLKLEPVLLKEEFASRIGLILNEALTNAFKYGLPGGSKPDLDIVLARKEGEGFRLIVKDRGPGLRHEKITKDRSFGMEMMRQQTSELGGKFKVEENGGVLVELEFDN